ncbi:hypothetical protein OPV22_017914 [Ensete ventricosum]|uniref:Uncharacterized protein n=1 Tax=Ensete ventricosum TaxID=4639 RepID=A0AAV8R320_ENSVE|nr:hypothetical protein OPV22_017914 [Ensete ventricosum]
MQHQTGSGRGLEPRPLAWHAVDRVSRWPAGGSQIELPAMADVVTARIRIGSCMYARMHGRLHVDGGGVSVWTVVSVETTLTPPADERLREYVPRWPHRHAGGGRKPLHVISCRWPVIAQAAFEFQFHTLLALLLTLQ